MQTKRASIKLRIRVGDVQAGMASAHFSPLFAVILSTLQTYNKAHAEFMEIGNRILQQREEGVALSLKAA